MSTTKHSPLADLRGATRMILDATKGVTGISEALHQRIQSGLGPLNDATFQLPSQISKMVYRNIHDVVDGLATVLDAGLTASENWFPEGASTSKRDAARAVINGTHGDYLQRTNNPLAIDMALYHDGQPIDLSQRFNQRFVQPTHQLSGTNGKATKHKILILLHGLCMNEQQWHRDGHDHGQELANECGYTPLYVRYNSGLPIAENGRMLSNLLQTLVTQRDIPLKDFTLLGHSMGGLVARSACHQASTANHDWLQHLEKMIFLGTPHHGAGLERGGYAFNSMFDLSAYSAPFARIGNTRSAGIQDLRHGIISVDGKPVALPKGVACYAAAAVSQTDTAVISDPNKKMGDGLVSQDSALGNHDDSDKSLNIPTDNQWTGYGLGHIDLLGHHSVYEKLSEWLKA